jgi:hypothetical protein
MRVLFGTTDLITWQHLEQTKFREIIFSGRLARTFAYGNFCEPLFPWRSFTKLDQLQHVMRVWRSVWIYRVSFKPKLQDLKSLFYWYICDIFIHTQKPTSFCCSSFFGLGLHIGLGASGRLPFSFMWGMHQIHAGCASHPRIWRVHLPRGWNCYFWTSLYLSLFDFAYKFCV